MHVDREPVGVAAPTGSLCMVWSDERTRMGRHAQTRVWSPREARAREGESWRMCPAPLGVMVAWVQGGAPGLRPGPSTAAPGRSGGGQAAAGPGGTCWAVPDTATPAPPPPVCRATAYTG